MNTISPTRHVGVDVGKDHLDFFCHESSVHLTVPNTPTGIRQALRQLPQQDIACLVVEATGRYERALVKATQNLGLRLVVAQPIAIRRLAGALGILAKTDHWTARSSPTTRRPCSHRCERCPMPTPASSGISRRVASRLSAC
jgi:transposase